MSKTIEIIVSPEGKTTVQTKGFAGSSCRQATKFLENTLGQVLSEQVTAEFHAQQETTRRNVSQK
jgi:hypothetical protein